ncbi:MAG: UDP-N-acetylglucosamine--N-acetylmuramyl-(pentapeptide) pyrophosphoryl-undecaprenol N-acetylglucosamine transferase [Candidatus Omnitrophota bacterium]|nr:UDP-N-acetylglucosamine--N-acetylmuramyl-(pentapeptide) pyrophosphoryl-undecaprenol N-acetylglucosamine transferase [Candidatus Omnitrophota bacterium]
MIADQERLPTVSVFAGPSGGHLFPALAFAEALRNRIPQVRVELVTSKRARTFEAQMAGGVFDHIIYLNDFPFSPGFSLRAITFLLKLLQAFWSSWRYLSEAKPVLAVGFGSYVSYPGMLLSSWKKIPTVIHEQNCAPGRATKWLAPHVDRVTTSFPGTFSKHKSAAVEFVGLPIRASVCSAARKTVQGCSGRNEILRLLVMGGSQGAHSLNRTVLQCFSLLESEEKRKIAVTHITGKSDYEEVVRSYRNLGVRNQIFPFFENIEDLYREADLAITRAGANTLFELALFRLPAIVVPYPHAGGHQQANAEMFEARRAILLKQESDFTGDWLVEQVRGLNKNLDGRRAMVTALEVFAVPDAAEKLVDVAVKIVEREAWKDLSQRMSSDPQSAPTS